MFETHSVEIKKDGYAYCDGCGEAFWKVPNYEKWVKGGYKPVAQTLLMGAHFGHLMKKHPKGVIER
jgi:hypothetical protein